MTQPLYLIRIIIGLVLGSVLACSKQKLDFVPEHLVQKDSLSLSNVRIIDLYGFNQLRANGEYITNETPSPNPEQYEEWFDFPGTKYFPFDGRFGNLWINQNTIDGRNHNWDGKDKAIWQIPRELFRKDRTLSLDFINLQYDKPIIGQLYNYALEDTGEPIDYFIAPYGRENTITPIKRETTLPKEGHFKLRVINFSADIPPFDERGIEQLKGAISLLHANGDRVDPKTSSLAVGAVSEYIELPYGTYQFKMQNEQKKLVPGSNSHNTYRFIDPVTSSIAFSDRDISNMSFAPVKYYAPGGIYTIIIAPLGINLFALDKRIRPHIQNLYTILEDNKPQANSSYSRVQNFNALWQDGVSFWVDGKQLGENLDFGQYSSYNRIAAGEHLLEVKDAKGQTLDKKELSIRPNQNLTLWAFPSKDKAVNILVQQNDLSDYRYGRDPFAGSSVDNSYYHAYSSSFPLEIRYLNLCPEIPYLSITNQDGQSVLAASNPASNTLSLGQLIDTYPYMTFDISNFRDFFKALKAYKASPQINPGTWIESIAQLPAQDFIANKQLYLQAGKELPNHEHGIFSVALIGSTDAQYAHTKYKARFALLRHIK